MAKVLLKCSFCDKKQDEIKKLITSKRLANICNECIELCMEILTDQNLVTVKAELTLEQKSVTEINADIQKHENTLTKLKRRLVELSLKTT